METRDINKSVRNNPAKFPAGYVFELDKNQKNELVENFHRFNKLKHSTMNPGAFTEKGLYMLATILNGDKAVMTTISIIETFSKIKELSRNINSIVKTNDDAVQKELAKKSNILLEDIIEVESDVLDDKDGEIIETTTKFEFNLGFAKVSRSIKKLKN